jgi:hypothetical protein
MAKELTLVNRMAKKLLFQKIYNFVGKRSQQLDPLGRSLWALPLNQLHKRGPSKFEVAHSCGERNLMQIQLLALIDYYYNSLRHYQQRHT